MYDVAMHVALGRPYRERRVHPGAVVYCAFEGQTGFEARVEAFRLRHLADDFGEVPFFLQPAPLDLFRDHQELIAVIRRQALSPVLVVLDTLNRSLAGSESSDEDMSAYVQAADAIRDAFDCAVTIIHHCGIDGTRPRGHTSLTGAVDVQLAVRRDAGGNIVVELELAKDGAQGETITNALEVVEVGTDEDGEMITSCVVVPAQGVPVAQKSRLPKTAQKVLAAFHRLRDDCRTEPLPFMPGPRGVNLDDLRDQALALGLFGHPEPSVDDKNARTKWRNGRDQAWKRGIDAVTKAGVLRLENNFVWEVGPRHCPDAAMTRNDDEH
jgi:hypothetical protein